MQFLLSGMRTSWIMFTAPYKLNIKLKKIHVYKMSSTTLNNTGEKIAI